MLEVALTQYNYYTDYHISNNQLLISIPILATTSIVKISIKNLKGVRMSEKHRNKW